MTKGKILVDALSFDFLPTSKKNIDKKVSGNKFGGISIWVDGNLAVYHNMKYFLIGSVINILYDFYYLCYFLRLQWCG